MKYFFLLILLMALTWWDATAQNGDTIVVKKDARLDVLTKKQILINKRTSMMTSEGRIRGYRLQLLSTNDRTKANQLKAELLTRFPNQKAYFLYQSPYFKIRFGNFLKRNEAENFKKELIKLYPQGVYVVEDAIEYIPKEDEDITL